MKSIYLFTCGMMAIITISMVLFDECGREFVQEYWISRIWYGDLNKLYRIIKIIIIFIDIMLIYCAGISYATDKKNEIKTLSND